MHGDERYLLARDQGPVRRFVRDLVDARRNVLGLFMPSALTLLFVMFAVPQLQLYISPAMTVLGSHDARRAHSGPQGSQAGR